MRRVFCLCLFIILLLVITSGCLQPAPKTTPATTTEPPTVTPLPVVTPADMPKNLTFDVSKTEKTVNVTYLGGPDSADLVALKIRIDNQDLDDFDRIVPTPVAGEQYIFTYMGLATPVTANIIGTWKDGYQQTVLMYYF
jgi:hypothetical protein